MKTMNKTMDFVTKFKTQTPFFQFLGIELLYNNEMYATINASVVSCSTFAGSDSTPLQN